MLNCVPPYTTLQLIRYNGKRNNYLPASLGYLKFENKLKTSSAFGI